MTFTNQFINEVIEIAKDLDANVIEKMISKLASVRLNKGRLFVLGIGGSAGNASHAVNDFRKLAGIDAYAPTDNISEITARTNDEGFESIFRGYLSVSGINSKDCLLVLSVGGGDLERGISVNLCSAIDYAKVQGAYVLAILGRQGGYAHKNADLSLVIPSHNQQSITPHSESFQAIVWHLMVSHPELKLNRTTW
jgi:D-sedoheptulose 7-phosphate isomerase